MNYNNTDRATLEQLLIVLNADLECLSKAELNAEIEGALEATIQEINRIKAVLQE